MDGLMDERLMRHPVIVFDIGNVLVRFDRQEIARAFGLSDALYRGIFESGLWLWLDTGLMTVGEIAKLMCEAAHTSSRSDYLLTAELLEHFDRVMQPLSGTLLLPELKKAGKRLYYLTNYGTPVIERTMERFPFFSYFDGGVISSHEHLIKPMPRIYQLLCEKYGFRPQDAVFIDDNADNIHAAEQLGFEVWQFFGQPLTDLGQEGRAKNA